VRGFLITLFVLISGGLSAQLDSLDGGLVRLIEEYIENNELGEDFDFNTLFDNLVTYQEQPLDLNEATEQELRDLQILSDIQVNGILYHRSSTGAFIDFNELQSINGFDLLSVRTLRPFVTVGGNQGSVRTQLRDRLRAGQSTLFLKWRRTLEDRRGFETGVDPETGQATPAAYAGDPNYLYTRYRFSAGRQLSFGFTAEKDAGESFFRGVNARQGFDFWSAFAYAEDLGNRVKAVALGDYTISMGQGLVLHNGFGTGKSSLVMNLKKGGRTIRPYSSVNEFNFFRGGAVTLQFGDKVQITPFVSYKAIDGRLDTVAVTEQDVFTSLAVDGLHRTASEIARKNTTTQINTGAAINLQATRNLKIGLNYLYTEFSRPLQRNATLFNKFDFAGTTLSNASVDYSYRNRNFNFFGEVAMSDNGATSMMHGLLATLDRRVDLSLAYRDYGRNYHVLFPNSFGESVRPVNERGLYVGTIVRPASRWTVSAYADFYQFPWARFRIDAPSTGRDYLLRVDYYVKRKFNAYVQYRWERKGINGSSDAVIDPVETITLRRFRINISTKLTKAVELRNRAEWSWADRGQSSSGYLIYQDLIYKPIQSPWSFSARYAIFDINSFDSRIYAYENDILYEFRIPFFQDTGQRYYINARYRLARPLTVEFRLAQTILSQAGDVQRREDLSFSGGNQLIKGNRFTEVKAQVRYVF
jgi:hypothetical protein